MSQLVCVITMPMYLCLPSHPSPCNRTNSLMGEALKTLQKVDKLNTNQEKLKQQTAAPS